MHKLFALIFSSAILLASSFLEAQPPANSRINWQTNYSQAVSQAQSSGKPIVILFTGTSWCPACMQLERTVLNNPEFAQMVGQNFVFLKAEFPNYGDAVATSPYKPLLDNYQVDAFPTMVVINASGQQLYRVNYRNGDARAYAQELLQSR